MEKTLGTMAKYMKQLLPMNIPETYLIDPIFGVSSDEENVQRGIRIFRDFINHLCDCLIEDKHLSGVSKRGKEKFSDETTLTVEFPFLNNIKSILINIGHYGTLSEQGDALLIADWDLLCLKRSLNKGSRSKISNPQMIKSLKFLTACGIQFIGIDLNQKKPDTSDIQGITVTYTEHPVMLKGWKILGQAQIEFATRKNDEILLRCDYRILNGGEDDLLSRLKEFVEPLNSSLQDLLLQLHDFYMNSGMTCKLELGFFCTHFIYSYKGKAVWRFSNSFHNGYRMVLKTKHMDKYTDIIHQMPDLLRERILRGYGCDRKKGTGHGNCQRGCEGFSFPLDDRILSMSEPIMKWQAGELKYS